MGVNDRSLPRYCAACGAGLNAYVDHDGLSRKRCPECDWIWYNNPLAIVLVLGETGDGRVLLTRKASWPAGMWGLVSGIVESGETPERTVIREVREESALEAADPGRIPDGTPARRLLERFLAGELPRRA